jgi:hypothetical protein
MADEQTPNPRPLNASVTLKDDGRCCVRLWNYSFCMTIEDARRLMVMLQTQLNQP